MAIYAATIKCPYCGYKNVMQPTKDVVWAERIFFCCDDVDGRGCGEEFVVKITWLPAPVVYKLVRHAAD